MLVTTAAPGLAISDTCRACACACDEDDIIAIIISIISIMAAINISPASSPVILDNPPQIGDQYLALSVLDCVMNETLRIKIPFVLYYTNQLVGAIISALGSHLHLIPLVNKHPNSHEIMVTLDVNDMTWT